MIFFLREFVLKTGVYFFILFIIAKTAFLWANRQDLISSSPLEIAKVYYYSLPLDFSVLSYFFILFLPVLLFLLKQGLVKASNYFTYSFIVITTLVIILLAFIDIELYSYWDSKLSAKALFFASQPGQVLKTAGLQNVLSLFLFSLLGSVIMFLFYWKIFKTSFLVKLSNIEAVLLFTLSISLCILGLRGGFREIPINQSDAYFSKNNTLNVAGVNSVWNFGNIIFQNTSDIASNPYKTMNDSTASYIVESLYTEKKDSCFQIINIDTPNIVFVIMEGVTANNIASYDSSNNYMPNLNAITSESLLYKNIYASGQRTDQGFLSLISGFPALPLHTLNAQPSKFQKLPSLTKSLKSNGYYISFFFAGEPEFGSIKAFLTYNEFDRIYSDKDFERTQKTQSLGVADEYLFPFVTKELATYKEPFFTTILNLSTHEPFDIEENKHLKNNRDKYINSVTYLDKHLGLWLSDIKNQKWFKNTLFVFTSDHGHTFPDNYWYTDKERYHIPFFVWGVPLNSIYQNKEITHIYGQTDIPYSFCKLLNINAKGYRYSKNIFNPYNKSFASFIYIHGNQFISSSMNCTWQYGNRADDTLPQDLPKEDTCSVITRAIIQDVFNEYMSY